MHSNPVKALFCLTLFFILLLPCDSFATRVLYVQFECASSIDQTPSVKILRELLKKNGFRLIQNVPSDSSEMVLQIVWNHKKKLLMKSKGYEESFRLPAQIRNPWLQARTVLTFIELFLDGWSEHLHQKEQTYLVKAKERLASVTLLRPEPNKANVIKLKKLSVRKKKIQRKTLQKRRKKQHQKKSYRKSKARKKSYRKSKSRKKSYRKSKARKKSYRKSKVRRLLLAKTINISKQKAEVSQNGTRLGSKIVRVALPKKEKRATEPISFKLPIVRGISVAPSVSKKKLLETTLAKIAKPKLSPRIRKVKVHRIRRLPASPKTGEVEGNKSTKKKVALLKVDRSVLLQPKKNPEQSWSLGLELGVLANTSIHRGVMWGGSLRLFSQIQKWRFAIMQEFKPFVLPQQIQMQQFQTSVIVGLPIYSLSSSFGISLEMGPNFQVWSLRRNLETEHLWRYRLGWSLGFSGFAKIDEHFYITFRMSGEFTRKRFDILVQGSRVLSIRPWHLGLRIGLRWKWF